MSFGIIKVVVEIRYLKVNVFHLKMGVSKNRGGKPPKWMVKIRENPIKMDDLGVPLFLETSRSTPRKGYHAHVFPRPRR